MLELINVNKTYHNKNSEVKALDNINLKFFSQGMTFIIGSSGCGKTTLLNIIAGNDRDYEGIVNRDGIVESIEQEIHLFENLSVLDNLLLVSDDKEQIDKLLTQFQLFEPNKKVKKLSGGERKRVQIIRSLLSKATYLICDEPTASLDHENGEMIMDLLKDISKDIGVIVVTHDIALVEKYKDRVIQMGKGSILEDDELIGSNNIDSINIEKRPIKKQCSLLFKLMKSRIGETIFRYTFLFFSVLTVFVMISLFPMLKGNLQAMSKWRDGKNVIISDPIDKRTIYKENHPFYYSKEAYSLNKLWLYFDTYQQEDIDLVKDNIQEVIGYRIGWDSTKYNYHSLQFVNSLNIDELRTVIEQYRDDYEKNNIEPFYGYEEMMYNLNKIDKKYPNNSYPKDKYNFVDNRYNLGFITKLIPCEEDKMIIDFDGTKKNVTTSFVIETMIPDWQYSVSINGISVETYELFPDVQLDLVAGHMPENNIQIVIDKKLGEKLMHKFHLTSFEELIGKEVSFVFFGYEENKSSIIDPYFPHSYSMEISGVTYMYSDLTNQVFSMEGTFEKPFVEEYGYNQELVHYTYLNFLVNPNSDSGKVSDQINKLLESKDSKFIVNNSFTVAQEDYQDPIQIMVFVCFTLGVLVSLYLAMHLLMNKRMKKEIMLLNRYNYKALVIQILMMSFLLVFVGIIQFFMLPYLCNGLNHLANSIGMANIVEYNMSQYVTSLMIVGVAVTVLEIGVYKIRMKV